MSVAIAPKYALGTQFYAPTTDREARTLDCPDCLGERTFRVIAPSGDEFTLECPRCSGGYRLSDVPSLRYDVHVPRVRSDEITGYCVNEYGKEGVRYRGKSLSADEADIITDPDVAMRCAEELAAKYNAEADNEPVRIHLKSLGQLPLKEATLDQFKNGLYDSWGAFRHLREVVDEVIENKDEYSYNERDKIVEALEECLSSTHRYDFIFKGFTRAMEAVVALVNADEEQTPEVLANLRNHWSMLPEDAQKAWQPPASIATDWSGKPCPTY